MALGTAGYTVGAGDRICCEHNGMAPGNGKVMVNGATGGCASLAIDMLAGLGYRRDARSPARTAEHDYLKKHRRAAKCWRAKHCELGTRPLEKGVWAAAFDSVGGDQLAALTRTMQQHGVIASFGNAGGIELNTTVLPFILRGVRLIGVDSGSYADAAPAQSLAAAGDRSQAAPSAGHRAHHHARRSAGASSTRCSKAAVAGRAVVKVSSVSASAWNVRQAKVHRY